MDIRSNKQVVVEFYAEDICNRYKHVSKCLQRCYKQDDLEELDNFIEECCKMCREAFHCNLIQVGACTSTDSFVIRPIGFSTENRPSADILVKVVYMPAPYKYRIKNYVGRQNMNDILPILYEELKKVIR